jgi:hypothetical protein
VCAPGLVQVGGRAHARAARTGYNCGALACPGGSDPQDWDQVRTSAPEVQSIVCYAESGKIAWGFRGVYTAPLPATAYVLESTAPSDYFGARASTFEGYLRQVNTTGGMLDVSVATPGATRLCGAGGIETLVAFRGLLGDAPLLTAQPDAAAAAYNGGNPVVVSEVVRGTLPRLECNARGVCNRVTGACSCMPQFGSSDGAGRDGQLGDCGWRDPLHGNWLRRVATLLRQPAPDGLGGGDAG